MARTIAALQALDPAVVCPGHGSRGDGGLLAEQRAFLTALRREVEARIKAGLSREAVLDDLGAIRAALTADPAAAGHVIPHGADLPALSLQAQVERTFDQIRSSRDELR